MAQGLQRNRGEEAVAKDLGSKQEAGQGHSIGRASRRRAGSTRFAEKAGLEAVAQRLHSRQGSGMKFAEKTGRRRGSGNVFEEKAEGRAVA